VKNNDRNPNGSHVGGTTRRDFLRKSTYAAAGLVATGFFQRNATAKEAKQKAAKGAKLELISPTFETSPTYLATYPASERAKKIMKEATVIDTLFSAVYPLQWKNDDQFHPVMDECMAAGMNVLGYCTSADVASPDPAAVLNGLKFPLRKIAERPDKYMIVRTGNDIREAKKQGKLGFYFVHQGTNQYGGDVDNVALMRQLGFGYCLLVYNNKNAVGGGCADDEDVGLTAYGRKLIQAYNRYGMVVDVNHTGNRTALDACEASAKPIIASHSGAKGVFNSFRNLSDELIVAIAKTGGVCSMFGTGAYIDPTNPKVVSPDIIFKHIDYMVQLHGNVDHVGYGSDWIPDMNGTMKLVAAKADTYPDMGMPTGTTKKAIEMYAPTANPARIMPAIVDLMLKAGYKEMDIHKFLGGNIIRVFDACWNGADVEITEKPDFAKDWR
jgi:membrane dipeptidase